MITYYLKQGPYYVGVSAKDKSPFFIKPFASLKMAQKASLKSGLPLVSVDMSFNHTDLGKADPNQKYGFEAITRSFYHLIPKKSGITNDEWPMYGDIHALTNFLCRLHDEGLYDNIIMIGVLKNKFKTSGYSNIKELFPGQTKGIRTTTPYSVFLNRDVAMTFKLSEGNDLMIHHTMNDIIKNIEANNK